MTRRELREQIFKLLFRIEFNERDEMPEQVRLFFEGEEALASEKEQLQITQKYDMILDKLSQIDEMIDQKAQGWKISRMAKVDLAILRLAVYEISFDEEIPTSVAINEAVELAKKFGQEESGKFVNGVLAKFAKETVPGTS